MFKLKPKIGFVSVVCVQFFPELLSDTSAYARWRNNFCYFFGSACLCKWKELVILNQFKSNGLKKYRAQCIQSASVQNIPLPLHFSAISGWRNIIMLYDPW